MTRLAEMQGHIASMDELLDIVGAMRSLAGMRVQESQHALPGIRSYADSMAAAISFSAASRVAAWSSFMATAPRQRGAPEKHVVEIQSPRRAGDPNAPPFALQASRTIQGRHFAGIVTIGEHDHVANLARQVEGAKARCRKRCPGRMAACLHRGKAGLNAFADHQRIAGWSEPHRAAAARPEHHLRRLDRRLPVVVESEKRAVNAHRLPSAPCVTCATIAGQTPPEGCFSPIWKWIDGGIGMMRPRDRR